MLTNNEANDFRHIEELFKTCSPFFIALGDAVRQKLILDIAKGGAASENGINVTDLSAMSRLSRPAISHHLKVLKNCGLIEPFKVGTQIFYKLSFFDDLKTVSELINSIQALVEKTCPGKYSFSDTVVSVS